jgi:hypothetical protein
MPTSAWLPIAPRRRPPRVPRPHSDPAPTRVLALGASARRRVQEAQDAPCAGLTATRPPPTTTAVTRAHAPREACLPATTTTPADTRDRSAHGQAEAPTIPHRQNNHRATRNPHITTTRARSGLRLALGAAALVSMIRGDAAWPLGSFAATTVYLLVASIELLLAQAGGEPASGDE